MAENRVFDLETGLPRLLSEQCSTCIGRPGNLMSLRPGRVGQMVSGSLSGGGFITCHQTLSYGDHPEIGNAVCRWFYDNFGARSNLLRIFTRQGGFTEVSPPE